MTPEQAQQTIRDLIGPSTSESRESLGFIQGNPDGRSIFVMQITKIFDVVFRRDDMEFRFGVRAPTASARITFKNIPRDLNLETSGDGEEVRILVRITPTVLFIVYSPSDVSRRQRAYRLIAALNALRDAALQPPVDTSGISDAQFTAIASEYRKRAVRGDISEEIRRFKVQAEFAIQQKRFEDAMRIYADALRRDPSWAEGQHNLAILLGESGYYRQATMVMNRFLALEPNAPASRGAQDKIYVWTSLPDRPIVNAADRSRAPEIDGPMIRAHSVATLAASQGCFVATAAYGSFMDPHVIALRRFRDEWLMTSTPGRAFVRAYYRYSPPLASIIEQNETLRSFARWSLAPIVLTIVHPHSALAAALVGAFALAFAIAVWRRPRK